MKLNPRALAGGILVGLVVAGSAFAVAQDSGEPSSDDTRTELRAPKNDGDDESQEVDFNLEGPSQTLVEQCKGGKSTLSDLHCDAVIAIDNGEFEPGKYSNEELREKLAE